MVIDSSALISVLFNEVDSPQFLKILDESKPLYMSSLSWFESALVAEAKKGLDGARFFNELTAELSIQFIPFDQTQAEIALDAWRRFGKGRHPAGLNLGDCASYALAKTLNQVLLFKGDDFSKTDVAAFE